jgi:uncharacterized membrane protein
MLTSFGIFWSAEGAGVSWPGNDVALLVIVPVTLLIALGYVGLLRHIRAAAVSAAALVAAGTPPGPEGGAR